MERAPDRYGAALDQFIARLASNPCVEGVVLMGSTAFGPVRPWSDYDLLVVFAARPAALRLVTTWIDGRIAELYCTDIPALDWITASRSHADGSEAGAVVRWLRDGRIAFDRSGRVAAARDAVRGIEISLPTDADAYEAWWWIRYGVAHMRRYAMSTDASIDLVLAMRLTYGLADVMTAYFRVRHLPWRGEKAAVAYWESHDRDFLETMSGALSAVETREKVERYIEAARLAVAPVGTLWSEGMTMFELGEAYGAVSPLEAEHSQADAVAAWDALFEDGTSVE